MMNTRASRRSAARPRCCFWHDAPQNNPAEAGHFVISSSGVVRVVAPSCDGVV